ncbi:MAG: BMP family ABC transporter substrate-binding protein [Oscillospiraceae bacterium]|nr:BMP family ABC transporter substrate-binding protein [Oscillospiraceae bacterium]
MKKLLALALSLSLALGMLAGCSSSGGGTASTPPSQAPENSNAPQQSEAPSQGGSSGGTIQINKEDLKVALVLPGSINDQGWSTSAYLGLQAIEEDYGCDTNYMENVAVAAYEEAFRNYASAGYNVIFGHGSEFFDAAEIVGAEFPDVAFIVTSTDRFAAPNVASLNTLPTEMGVLGGVCAAYASKSGVIGAIGGSSLVSIVGAVNAYSAAALMTKPDLKVLTNMTGDDFDAAKCKEVAQAMIDQGADVIFYDADAAGLGALEACEENGILAIPAIADASALAPNTVVMSACNAIGQAMDAAVGMVVEGSFEGKFYPMGCDTGCVFYTKNDSVWDANMSDEGKAAVEDAYQKMASKELDAQKIIDDYLPDAIRVS